MFSNDWAYYTCQCHSSLTYQCKHSVCVCVRVCVCVCVCVFFLGGGQYFLCEIRGFRIGGAENSVLQRCDAMLLDK